MSVINENFEDVMRELSQSMWCGGDCGEIIKVDSPYSCEVCGRMLCEKCYKTWGLCEYHNM